MRQSTYFFDTALPRERERLLAQALMWDPVTFRRIGEAGITEGWRCLEVGAGSGTVARWLADRVGGTGHVTAIDLRPIWLRSLEAPNVEVKECDVTSDPLGDSRYDLITLRLVLAHLPDPARIIGRLLQALVPGGRLVIEEYDMRSLPLCHPPDTTWEKVAAAPAELVARAGADPVMGTKLASLFHAGGLVDIDVEAIALPRRVPQVRNGWQPQFVELRERLIEAGLVSAEEVDKVIADFEDETCDLVVHGPTLVSARGRRP